MAFELVFVKKLYNIKDEKFNAYIDLEEIDDECKKEASIEFNLNGTYYYEMGDDLEYAFDETTNIEITDKKVYIRDKVTEEEIDLEETDKKVFDELFERIREFIKDEAPFHDSPLELNSDPVQEFIEDELIDLCG